MKRLIASSLLPAAVLGSALLPAPALAQSCPNQNFALIDADTSFLASKDNNENGKVVPKPRVRDAAARLPHALHRDRRFGLTRARSV
jgi:hypothetical protein